MPRTEALPLPEAAEAPAGPAATVATSPSVACTHCGLPVPAGLVRDGEAEQFCCGGCRTAYGILRASGLDRYYDLHERRELAVAPTGRSYEEFDHPTFTQLYVRPVPGGLAEVELYLEGVHCASCVWLVERVPLMLPGVARAELEIRRSLARVTWDAAALPLSRVARMLDALGYPPHPFRGVQREALRRRADREMLVRIGVAGAIAINVMLAALALYSDLFGDMEAQYERFFRWVSFALTTPAMLWPGRVFFSGAWSALRARTLHMDVPIALGLAAGYAQGAVNTILDRGPVYFDGLAILVFALLVGRYVQQRGQRAAGDATELLFSLTPRTARIVDTDGRLHDVPAEALTPGMLLDVRAGETFAADGVVERGRSQLDTSLLTGESRPGSVEVGDPVYAGTLNLASPLRVRVAHTGEESRVARIVRQVEESAVRKAPVVQTANRVAAWFVAVVLALAALTWLVWLQRDPGQAADNAIALLIVTCPCALALSTPLAVSMAIGRAARAGIFIKGGDALERLAHTGRMILDKTGTITEARTALVEWRGPDWVKPLVLALERGSSHPIAAGFRHAWPDLDAPVPAESRHVTGGGILGRVDGHRVVVGSWRFVTTHSRGAVPAELERALTHTTTPVFVAVNGQMIASAALGDPVRLDSASSIRALRSRGWRLAILSGDAADVVATVGKAVGIAPEDAVGGATPEDKLAAVERLARGGDTVVMVGDGVNDAAAIAAASVGVGVHGGAEACLASADVYLTKPGLAPLVQLVEGAARTMWVIRRNIGFSLVYNVIGAALAMTGMLTPLIAAILMPASSLTVVLASWRSRTFTGEGGRATP